MAGLNNDGKSSPPHRTLLDIIRDDRTLKDKKSWKTFRDKLRLKRAGSAWTSSVRVPTSDVNVQGSRSRSPSHGSPRSNSSDTTHAKDGGECVPVSDPPVVNSKMQLARRDSISDAPRSRSSKPQMARHPSIRLSSASHHQDDDDDEDEYDVAEGSDDEEYESPEEDEGSQPPVEVLSKERSLSAREAVAAQEAAEAAAGKGAVVEPVKMSLMDLLGETGYGMGEDDDDYDDEEEDEEEDEVAVSLSGGMEYTCGVCMVRHKGSAFIPCAHTFCRLCSRELMVQRGNCPLCNGYILEILDIF
ncbi:hypothetical protein GOBAR_AA23887 [Gossypium barbadense]|uniref:RING-type domain-containing protein n=1 Tax=Gossypium barbadense TaxID=3634 RepID=A0A2P5X0A7_GOSBA|nr:hypothetical protein GOBAR_AA23887 [Gossypium barbadense]